MLTNLLSIWILFFFLNIHLHFQSKCAQINCHQSFTMKADQMLLGVNFSMHKWPNQRSECITKVKGLYLYLWSALLDFETASQSTLTSCQHSHKHSYRSERLLPKLPPTHKEWETFTHFSVSCKRRHCHVDQGGQYSNQRPPHLLCFFTLNNTTLTQHCPIVQY